MLCTALLFLSFLLHAGTAMLNHSEVGRRYTYARREKKKSMTATYLTTYLIRSLLSLLTFLSAPLLY